MASCTRVATPEHCIRLTSKHGKHVVGATPNGLKYGDTPVFWNAVDTHYLLVKHPETKRFIDKSIYSDMTAEMRASIISKVCTDLPNTTVYWR